MKKLFLKVLMSICLFVFSSPCYALEVNHDEFLNEETVINEIDTYVSKHLDGMCDEVLEKKSVEKVDAEIIDEDGNKTLVKAVVIDTTNLVNNNTDEKFKTIITTSTGSVYHDNKVTKDDPQKGIQGFVTMGYIEKSNGDKKLTHVGGGYKKLDSHYRVSSQLLTYDNRGWNALNVVTINQYGQKSHTNETSFSHPTGFTQYTDDTITVTNRLTVRHGTGSNMQVYTFNVIGRVK